jgi:transcriptional antiterminator NusG
VTDSNLKVVCCSSGKWQENKVKAYIENEISRLEMVTMFSCSDGKVVTVKDGKKLIKDKVYFP